MAEQKEAPQRYTSPKGVAKYPKLSEPDTKFKTDGEYSVKLLLDADAAMTKDFLKLLDDLSHAAYESTKKDLKLPKAKTLQTYTPYKDELDRDTGDPTGNIEITFKTGASFKDKKTGEVVQKAVPMFDAAGKKIETKINVGGGTVLKVNFTPFEFYAANGNEAGVSLRINAVQILDLKSYSGKTAEEYGFGKEEGGFEADAAEKFEGQAPEEGKGDF